LASLDAARKREILPYLQKLRDEAHVPMVYVSHHAPELKRIATSVVLLDGGRVAAAGGLDVLDAATAELTAKHCCVYAVHERPANSVRSLSPFGERVGGRGLPSVRL